MSSVNPKGTPPPAGEPNQPEETPAPLPSPILLPSPGVQKLLEQRSRGLADSSRDLGSAMSSVVSPAELQSMVERASGGEDIQLSQEQLEQAEKGAEEITAVIDSSVKLAQELGNEFNILVGDREKSLKAGVPARAHAPEYIAGLRRAANSGRSLQEVLKKCLELIGRSEEELRKVCELLGERNTAELENIYQDEGKSLGRLAKLGLVFENGRWGMNDEGLFSKLRGNAEQIRDVLKKGIPTDEDITKLELELDEKKSPSACTRILETISATFSRLFSLLNRLYDRLVFAFFFLLRRLGLISGGPRPLLGVTPDAAAAAAAAAAEASSSRLQVGGAKKGSSDRSDLSDEEQVRRAEGDSSGTQEDPQQRQGNQEKAEAPSGSEKGSGVADLENPRTEDAPSALSENAGTPPPSEEETPPTSGE